MEKSSLGQTSALVVVGLVQNFMVWIRTSQPGINYNLQVMFNYDQLSLLVTLGCMLRSQVMIPSQPFSALQQVCPKRLIGYFGSLAERVE